MAAAPDFSLEELSSEVARQLAGRGLHGASQDGRVSAAPDARTVRYYTTLGLLDRPRIESRQAHYGSRHLLQLLAVKALQAAGLPLAEIQQRLYGRSDPELEKMVALLSERRTADARETARHVPALQLREVALEPGLRLVVEEGWTPRDPAALEQRIRAVIAALQHAPAPDRANGGKR